MPNISSDTTIDEIASSISTRVAPGAIPGGHRRARARHPGQAGGDGAAHAGGHARQRVPGRRRQAAAGARRRAGRMSGRALRRATLLRRYRRRRPTASWRARSGGGKATVPPPKRSCAAVTRPASAFTVFVTCATSTAPRTWCSRCCWRCCRRRAPGASPTRSGSTASRWGPAATWRRKMRSARSSFCGPSSGRRRRLPPPTARRRRSPGMPRVFGDCTPISPGITRRTSPRRLLEEGVAARLTVVRVWREGREFAEIRKVLDLLT
jgi:hypothetical protein